MRDAAREIRALHTCRNARIVLRTLRGEPSHRGNRIPDRE